MTLAHRLGQPGLEFRPTSIQFKGKISGALARKRYQQGHLEVFADLATNQKAGSSNLSGRATSPRIRELQRNEHLVFFVLSNHSVQ